MKHPFLILIFSLFLLLGKAQDLQISYTIQDLGLNSQVEIYFTNMTAFPIQIGAVNLSMVFQSACGSYDSSASLFEDEWGTTLAYDQDNPLNKIYNGDSFDYRFQYGNTSPAILAPTSVDLLPLGGTPELAMTLDFSTDCPLIVYVEDLAENFANEITDLAGDPISYSVVNSGGQFPVEWLDFQAYQSGFQTASLEWLTQNEVNNDHFVIERSLDLNVFEAIGTINANPPGPGVQSYQYEDREVRASKVYYRIKQIDLDGRFSYSAVREVNFEDNFAWSLQVFPNPADHLVQVQLYGPDGYYQLQLMDQLGREIHRQHIQAQSEIQVVEIIVSELPSGIYTLRVEHMIEGTFRLRRLMRL